MPNPSLDISQLRVPPHSIEAEYSVLGGLLLDNSVLDRIGDLLTDSDFYRFEHRLIYGACRALISEGRPADVVTVYEELSRKGSADEVGGIACLNSLAQYVPSAANTHRYAEIVRERLDPLRAAGIGARWAGVGPRYGAGWVNMAAIVFFR